MARGTSTPWNFGAAFDTDSPLILISWPVPVMTPAGWRPRIRCCGARRNECATRCELRPAECEPLPQHAQDFNFTVVRAYKRSCEYVDSVIKIGRRSRDSNPRPRHYEQDHTPASQRGPKKPSRSHHRKSRHGRGDEQSQAQGANERRQTVHRIDNCVGGVASVLGKITVTTPSS